MRLFNQFVVAALVLLPFSGCGGPETPVYPVTGKVTYNGKPLPTGSVTYIPIAAGPSATGRIREDGTYTLTTFTEGDGAVPGDHQVLISAMLMTTPEALPAPLLPDKFSSGNSGVTKKVEPIDQNTLDLELTGPVMKETKPVVMP